ncbi:PREDICTED: protein VASCULAR ASSOCIATED DEATH 1, chloroplastic-like [Camelina sativa]|uniref:Protein VASCULAR ASSOCIATED DEATH 1, chloroplastic-like n=1 Tax=Camelina sativa TaxID=90675 RepID=A0ABM0X1T2_CAMSA|nr:PREDICTED: protein VASCULAR ASSOCIATED DEATH 1, chloroplastic-like [Camelina sativa]
MISSNQQGSNNNTFSLMAMLSTTTASVSGIQIDSSAEVVSDPTPSSPEGSRSGGSPDRHDPSTSSPSPSRGGGDNNQSEVMSRSEEYRQLFRLPAEEVLVQDFNCACQESILLQGHMYLFIHYICFYSNIFGYETKKIIPFAEISCVKRAKTAGIFPNAIEILAGGKKYFFASFLSRDEAFKLIHDGWLEYGTAVKPDGDFQDSLSESKNQVNDGVVKRALSSIDLANELDIPLRDENLHLSGSSSFSVISQNGVSPSSVQRSGEPVEDIMASSSANTFNWKPEDINAPKLSSDFTKVAEAKFSIPVEEFFRLFFSDGAVSFVESFHKNCGDKEFRCTSWQPHEKLGHTRNVSFQHPIKIYFGAKFGGCQESQKFRMYRDSHLVIETSQEISDVPYADYFTVEGVWDVKRDCRDSIEGCVLDVYLNVAFSKRTVWKGKIVHSTLEECREAYAHWIRMAHELLKQKKLENQKGNKLIEDGVPLAVKEETVSECEEERKVEMVGGGVVKKSLSEVWVNLTSFVKRQSGTRQVIVIAFAVILLMQVTIVVLLKKGGGGQVEYHERYDDYSGHGASLGWLEKRMHFLREEMMMVEDRLQRMRQDHAALKAQFHHLEGLIRRNQH